MSDHVRVEDSAAVRVITFNRADKKNALTRAMYAAAADALESAGAEKDVRAILITGEGDSFTAGNDLNDFVQHPPWSEPEGETPPVQRFMTALMRCEKPVVAAVNGLAVGIGVTMLPHCDIVYASRMATFSTPFLQLGIAPEYASTITLPAIMGRAKAAEMLLLGEKFSADEAERAGLVARIFPQEELADEALKRARRLAAQAPRATLASKALLRAETEPLEPRMHREAELFAELLQSTEFKEAAAAFFEKRQPDFSKAG